VAQLLDSKPLSVRPIVTTEAPVGFALAMIEEIPPLNDRSRAQ
jgi:hypothetical protein